VDHVVSLIPRVQVFGLVDTLEHLEKGGRIGGARALLGSLLSIKPVVTLVDGKHFVVADSADDVIMRVTRYRAAVLALAERYPDLKANAPFVKLQSELSDLESQIQASRQIYNGNVWAGLKNPSQNSIYLVTNNKWNWFVYQGVDFTVTKQTSKINLIGTYTRSWDHIAGTWQPNDPASIIQPSAFADNAGLGTVRGNTTNSLTGSADTRDRMWQYHQFRTGVTWSAPWQLRIAGSLTAQSGTPTGPMTTNIAAPDPQYGPTTLVINGRTVSNPLATTYRFAYANRGDGQLWCPWLIVSSACDWPIIRLPRCDSSLRTVPISSRSISSRSPTRKL